MSDLRLDWLHFKVYRNTLTNNYTATNELTGEHLITSSWSKALDFIHEEIECLYWEITIDDKKILRHGNQFIETVKWLEHSKRTGKVKEWSYKPIENHRKWLHDHRKDDTK